MLIPAVLMMRSQNSKTLMGGIEHEKGAGALMRVKSIRAVANDGLRCGSDFKVAA
jgi:hypothetical protein